MVSAFSTAREGGFDMASYKRVVLTEKDNTVREKSNIKPKQQTTTIKKHLDKFNTSYNAEKLNQLYEEFDSISIDNTSSATVSKQVQSVKSESAVGFKPKLYLTSVVLGVMMMAFLAIFNIFVINDISSGINLLQQEVTTTELNVKRLYDTYKNLNNAEKIEGRVEKSGLVQLPVNSIDNLPIIESVEVNMLTANTNWFDQLSSFIARMLGS